LRIRHTCSKRRIPTWMITWYIRLLDHLNLCWDCWQYEYRTVIQQYQAFYYCALLSSNQCVIWKTTVSSVLILE
jgi:hypothetical protein